MRKEANEFPTPAERIECMSRLEPEGNRSSQDMDTPITISDKKKPARRTNHLTLGCYPPIRRWQPRDQKTKQRIGSQESGGPYESRDGSRTSLKCAGKRERLRHRLCSSHKLLRESSSRGYMHHRSPWCDHHFRSSKPQLLLAESVSFFRSGCPSGCPAEQITQPTSGWQVLFRQSFQPSTQPN